MKQTQQDKLYRAIGENIRLVRARKGFSQAQLAQRISLSRVSIVNIEKGRQRPPLHVLFDIAQELTATVPELLPEATRRAKKLDVRAHIPEEYQEFVEKILSARGGKHEIERPNTRSGKKRISNSQKEKTTRARGRNRRQAQSKD